MYGETLKNLREAKGLNRKEFSYMINVSYDKLKNWENGITTIPIDMIVPICEALECSTDKFLNLKDKDFEWYVTSKDDEYKLLKFIHRSDFNKKMALYIFNEFEGNPKGVLMMSNLFTCLPPVERIQVALFVWRSFEYQYILHKDQMPKYAEEMKEYKNEYLQLCNELNGRIKNFFENF